MFPTAKRALTFFGNEFQEGLSLRTKLLFSFAVLSAGLTCAALFAVHTTLDSQTRRRTEIDARNGALMFRELLQQQQTALNHKADLLASVAYMRGGDTTAIDEAGADPWSSADTNLYLLTDAHGLVTAKHSTEQAFSSQSAQEMMSQSISRNETSGWWYGDGKLYQVAIQPFYEEGSDNKTLQGYVVVGRVLDRHVASLLATVGSSNVVIRYGGKLAVSTLSPLVEASAAQVIPPVLDMSQFTLDGEPFYATSLKLNPSIELIVLKSSADVIATQKRLHGLLFGIGLVTIIIGAALIFVLCDKITRPLGSLVEGVQALERGDFDYPVSAGEHDEVSKLTRAFDSMRATLQRNELQREELECQLRQIVKMEALGRLAGGVAHDFNNLLTVIRGHSELILDRLTPSDALYGSSEQIRKTSDRAASLTRQLLAFSRKQIFEPKLVDANHLIAECGKLLRRLIREDIEFSLQLGESLWHIKADPGQLDQVFMNLAVNASDAMPVGGTLTIETRNCIVDENRALRRPSLERGEYVLVTVSDNGQGMDEVTKRRIFEPFFTTKEPGEGTGLGLATVYGVVKQSGGFIWVESELAKGTRFELYFPRVDRQSDARVAEIGPTMGTYGGSKATILVVEDEAAVRHLVCEFLTSAGFRVLSAEDGTEALEVTQRFGQSIEAVLTDIVMPKMRGPQLASQIEKLLPNMKIMYMTGYLDESSQLLDGGCVLQKPFSRETLVSHVNRALEATRYIESGAVSV